MEANNQTVEELQRENRILKNQLEELRVENEFNHRYRELVESLGEIVLVAQDGKIVYGNRKMEERFGLSLEVLSRSPFLEFIHPDDHKIVVENYVKRMNDATYRHTYPFRVIDTEVGFRWIKISAVHIDWHGRPATLNILTDIHDRVIAENQLQREKKRAEEAAQMEARFLANMSHEIRTPMNGVLGMTQLLLDTELTPLQAKYLTTVEHSSQYLLHVINDILDYSQIEAGKMSIFKDGFDLHHVIKQLRTSFTYSSENKGIEFNCHLADSVPQYVSGDQARITQIITNLLSNAIKFTSEGSVTFSVDYSGDTSVCIFRVEDTGMGIPEDMVKTIFKSFAQVESPETRHHEGTGLGLTISQQLAELMHGSLTCDSTEGEGTVFTLRLPLKEDSATVPKLKKKLEAKEYGLHIHVVEDNDVNYLVMQKFLEKLGCTTTRSADGYTALKNLENEKFDLVFMDVQMPGIDGYETTRRIREIEKFRSLPIIGMTANAMKQDEERCYDAGMNYYISKPVEFNKLPLILDKISS